MKKTRHDLTMATAADLNTDRYAGERMAQQQFGVAHARDANTLAAMLEVSIPPRLAAFVEALPFFFIATANARGECDCSYRGREHDVSGRPYPLVKVIDDKTVIFPDYRGNNFYNSLGNMLVNGQIGMLFIDFETRRRVRINGRASIIDEQTAYAKLWPLALRYVGVSVEQVYGNCRARIPRMQMLPPTDSEFQDE